MTQVELVFVALTFAIATGFRLLIPLFLCSLLSNYDVLVLRPEFAWLSSSTTVVVLGLAVGIELLAYTIPVLDNVLDAITVPATLVIGTISAFVVMPGDIQLPLAAALSLTGAGGAATVAAALAKFRLLSTVSTGGIGNVPLSFLEAGASVGIPLLSSLFLFAGVTLVACVVLVLVILWRRLRI